jgi:hypothetical protein
MQFVGKLTEADLSDVQKTARLRAYWPALSLEAIPKLLIHAVAVLIALASTVAVLLVALPSIGCYLLAKLLDRIRPLHDAYQSVSGAYERFIDRLGRKVLRDPRDTPALRLMISVSLTALPSLSMKRS